MAFGYNEFIGTKNGIDVIEYTASIDFIIVSLRQQFPDVSRDSVIEALEEMSVHSLLLRKLAEKYTIN